MTTQTLPKTSDRWTRQRFKSSGRRHCDYGGSSCGYSYSALEAGYASSRLSPTQPPGGRLPTCHFFTARAVIINLRGEKDEV